MMYQGRSSQRAAQVARSQLALRLGIAAYAAASTLLILRCLALLLSFPGSVWTVQVILSISAPIVLPLSLVPAAQRVIVGSATLADLTAALILIALPLPFLGGRMRS